MSYSSFYRHISKGKKKQGEKKEKKEKKEEAYLLDIHFFFLHETCIYIHTKHTKKKEEVAIARP